MMEVPPSDSFPRRKRLSHFTSRTFLAIVLLPVLAAYLAATDWRLPYNVDAFTNALTSWKLGTHGSVDLTEEFEGIDIQALRGKVAWVVDVDGRVFSQYPPGAALIAAPVYAVIRAPATREIVSVGFDLDRPFFASSAPVPPVWPASMMGAVSTAFAVGFLGLVFRPLVGDRVAVIGAWVAGLGTTAWSVAADGLWQHGPAMMWIALGMYLTSQDRFRSGGLAFGAAILTRPHTGIVAATTGIAQGIRHRRWTPVLQLGAAAALGLAALLAYNRYIFGVWTISGGYGSDFTDQFVSGDLGWFVRNVWGGLFDLRRGFLVWSPFLIVLLAGVPNGWKASPSWVRGAAIGGALYLLVQYQANRFSGGEGHFTYRYPLEALTAAAPLLALSYSTWVATHPLANRLFIATATASITAHAIGAFTT